MANGLAPYICNDIMAIAGQATPSRKLNLNGFLAVCYNNNINSPITTIFPNGNKKDVTVRYRQRPTVAMTDTAQSCTDVLLPARLEVSTTVGSTRQIAYMLSDQLVASYNEEAAQRMAMGGNPNMGASAEMMDIIYSAANALLTAMNTDMLGLLSWGKNVVSNLITATTLNINPSAASNLLTEGEAKLLSDYTLNGLGGRPQIVGAGLFHAYSLQQSFKGLNNAGINTAIANAGWDFFPDSQFATTIGANNIGVFESGSVHVLEALEYQGFAAGQFPGDSVYGTIPINYTDFLGNTAAILFDFQLRYITCPTVFVDAYTGSNAASQTKGWQLILKKNFGLFQIPSDAYRLDDPKNKVNGALRYNVTNA